MSVKLAYVGIHSPYTCSEEEVDPAVRRYQESSKITYRAMSVSDRERHRSQLTDGPYRSEKSRLHGPLDQLAEKGI